jgi:hypothetical protein
MMNRDKNMFDEIARVAYGLYEKRGPAPGHDFADWIEAEKIVMKKYSQGKAGNETAIKSTRPMRTPGKTNSNISRPRL